MKPKDDLFRLIKSLSRSEKRYFTLDAKKSGSKSSQYLKLFKAINAMDEYEESLFPKELTNISVGKAYLYEAILKSMRDYRSPKSKRAQLKQRIMDAKFLYERGLYDQCADRLRVARNLAVELSDTLMLLEINREERRLAKERGISVFKEKFIGLKEDINLNVQAVRDEFKYLDIFDSLAIEFSAKFRHSVEEDIKAFKKRMKQETWKEPSGIQGKLRFFPSMAYYHHLIGESEKASEYFKKSVDLWDQFPALKREEFFRYTKALANAIAFSFYAGKIDLIETYLEKLEEVPASNYHEENLKFRTLISHRINYLIAVKQFSKAEELEEKVEIGLAAFDLRSSFKLTIWLQTASMMMSSKNLTRAKFWLRKIINFKDLKTRRDIQKGARVLNALISAQMDDYETTDLLIRSYLRYFKKHYQSKEAVFEIDLMNLLKNLIQFPFERKEKAALNDFCENHPDSKRAGISRQLLKGWLEINAA